MTPLARQRPATVHELLKCVWSGHPAGGAGRCHAHVPASVVLDAWQQEMAISHRTEGFFHFSWRSERWLGYGATDGSVRGVYCATHSSERSARIVGSEQRDSLAARPGKLSRSVEALRGKS